MLRTIEIPGDQIEVREGQIEVHANIGPVQVVSATFRIEDGRLNPDGVPADPAKMSYEEWEKNFNEVIALAPHNHYPCDDSREAIYGPDPEEVDPA